MTDNMNYLKKALAAAWMTGLSHNFEAIRAIYEEELGAIPVPVDDAMKLIMKSVNELLLE